MKVLEEFKTGKPLCNSSTLVKVQFTKSGSVRIVLQSTPLVAAQNTKRYSAALELHSQFLWR